MTCDQAGQADPAIGPQAAIEQARAALLAGRGPGATPLEITRHTRARTWLGGQRIAQQREQLSQHTALARRDPTALALQAADPAQDTQAMTTPPVLPGNAESGRWDE